MTYGLHKRFIPQTGFTLVEVLIVVVIVAVLIGVATLSLGAATQRNLHAEADRLRLVLQHCADSALFNQQTLGWFQDKKTNRYQVRVLDNNQGWLGIDNNLFTSHALPDNIILSIKNPLPPTITAQEETTGIQQKTPQLAFFSSGEYLPFTLILQNNQSNAWMITGDGLGNIQLTLAQEN